jgi:branched-chain amino acid transport system permease protein
MLDAILSQAVNGLVLGFLYVLIAVGLTIIFGLLGIVNFAHGALFALGAYLTITFYNLLGWPAMVLAPFAIGAIGMLIEFVLVRRLYREDALISLILTFALALFIEALIRVIWGSAGQPFSPPAFLSGYLEYGPMLVTRYRVAILVSTIALLILLWAFLQYTPFGRILRAGGHDSEMVGLLGINLPRVFTGAFGLGSFLAGVAGLLAAPLWTVTPSISESAVMPAFVTVAIGGLGSYSGAIVAGLAIGLVTALTIQVWPEGSTAAMYVLMALVLLVRPRGLFGHRWERFE